MVVNSLHPLVSVYSSEYKYMAWAHANLAICTLSTVPFSPTQSIAHTVYRILTVHHVEPHYLQPSPPENDTDSTITNRDRKGSLIGRIM